MEIKVSIITVVLNGMNTIEQTINSVLNQDYDNIEYLIIDGGSTDGTLDIIDKYKDNISYFVSESDSGLYNAMNKGIKAATGNIIGILNSDDWYEKWIIQDVVKAFNEETDIVYGELNLINKENNFMKRKEIQPVNNLLMTMTIPHTSVFVKKAVYDKYGLYDEKYKIAADYDFLLRVYLNNVKFKKIDKVLANFRLTGISSTDSNTADEIFSIMSKYMDFEIMNSIITKFLLGHNKLVIYGAGNWGKWIITQLDKMHVNNYRIVDGNEDLVGQRLGTAIIENINDVIETKNEFVFIAVYHSHDIEQKIRPITSNSMTIRELFEQYISKYLMIHKIPNSKT